MSDTSHLTPDVRYTVHFSGRVQGVGFRYRTINIASRYQVSGIVENLPDGRVRLVAEGSQEEVSAFVREIVQWMGRNIRDYTVDPGPATGEFGVPGLDALTVRY